MPNLDGLCPLSHRQMAAVARETLAANRTATTLSFFDLFGFAGSSQRHVQVTVLGRWGGPKNFIKFLHHRTQLQPNTHIFVGFSYYPGSTGGTPPKTSTSIFRVTTRTQKRKSRWISYRWHTFASETPVLVAFPATKLRAVVFLTPMMQ